jgi:3-hydroxybutyryl-CoA dehydrogenase
MFERIGLVGAGTMGHGIAHVAALAGSNVVLYDVTLDAAQKGFNKVKGNLEKGVEKGKLSGDVATAALSRISLSESLEDFKGCSLIVEAIPEKIELKQELFKSLDGIVPDAILATNTSSLSVAKIASAVHNPARVIGTHFFNPVHIMELLEIVVHPGTSPEVLAAIQGWGTQIQKQCITVKDFPGFATSRLGVALGMEAIRMVEQGVASPEDIDKAMVLGYRHPVGPLKLTDMVGLDIRMNIGIYLAKELNNLAFEPPALMRKMVAEGKLGAKTKQGFYSW